MGSMFWKSAALNIAVMAIAMAASQAQAALENRGGGMIYDTVNNVTWLADMNYAQTSGFDTDGLMSWTAAKSWAENLSFGGFDDWRLPTANPLDSTCSAKFNAGGSIGWQYYGTGCTGGEITHLFVVDLGNKGSESVLEQAGDTSTQKSNLGLFQNVRSWYYWTDTESAQLSTSAWWFDAHTGRQDLTSKTSNVYAIAVRDGDVTAVPEPQTLAMMLVGVGLLAAAMRRRKA